MMTCKILNEDRWHRFLENKLSVEESAEIDAHLEEITDGVASTCPDCTRFLGEMDLATETMLRDMHHDIMGRHEHGQVMSSIDSEIETITSKNNKLKRKQKWMLWFDELFAAGQHNYAWAGGVATFAIVGLVVLLQPQSQEQNQFEQIALYIEKSSDQSASSINVGFSIGTRNQDGRLELERGLNGNIYKQDSLLFLNYEIGKTGYVYLVGVANNQKPQLLYSSDVNDSGLSNTGRHQVLDGDDLIAFPLEGLSDNYTVFALAFSKPIDIEGEVIHLIKGGDIHEIGSLNKIKEELMREGAAVDVAFFNISP